jgi:hypothetical protein
MRGFKLTTWVLLALLSPAAGAGAGAPYAGRPLPDVLADLQAQGIRIVYSSAVVTPAMVVLNEPGTSAPRAILDEILEPHGLAAEDGPGGTVLVVVAPRAAATIPDSGEVRGSVTTGGIPVATPDMAIEIEDTPLRVAPAPDGTFMIPDVPSGRYTVTVTSTGFVPQSITDVDVRPGGHQVLRFDLVPVSVFLNEVVVTPSHFRLLDTEPESRQFLDREEVRQMPHTADDLYRAVKRLPGAAGGDISARINVRGGEQDELLVMLDGLELYEPFHLKDFQSVFSIIDSEAVGGVDFLTGGFPVEYGDRMSGVMDISVATPVGPATTAIEVSTFNARLLTQGTFDLGLGQYFVSARTWYPDAVVGLFSENSSTVATDYYDLLAKVQHQVGQRSELSIDFLAAYDDLGFNKAAADEVQNVGAEYASYNAWLNMHTQWSPHLYSQTVLSVGRLTRQRKGAVDDVVDGRLDVDDNRTFEFIGLSQDWTIALSDRNVLKTGFDVVRQEATYSYLSTTTLRDPDSPTEPLPPTTGVDTDLQPEGTAASMYVGDRFLVGAPLVVELGLRWDRQSWIGDHQLSPRVNLMYSLSDHSTLRAAWGRFYQSQRLNELQVEDGVEAFYPAQLANHWLLSLEHSFSPVLASRFEVFRKDLSDLRPRYENLFSPLQLFPEAEADRVRVAPEQGLVRGLELVFKGTAGPRLSWWASYALARAEDRINGAWQPRSWDQQNALAFGLNANLPHRWTLSIAGIYHSGWPTTPVAGEAVFNEDGEPEIVQILGTRNSARYPPYARLDLRVGKLFPTTRGGLTVYLEVLNLTDRKNVCCTEDWQYQVGSDGSVTVTPQYKYWAPIIPTLGIGWQF